MYKNEWDKDCFAQDAAYSDSKDLAKRIISGKVLKERAYEIAINHKYDGYQRGLASVVYKFFFCNKTQSRANANVSEELSQELHETVIKKFRKKRVCVRFTDNIWAAELAKIGSLSS